MRKRRTAFFLFGWIEFLSTFTLCPWNFISISMSPFKPTFPYIHSLAPSRRWHELLITNHIYHCPSEWCECRICACISWWYKIHPLMRAGPSHKLINQKNTHRKRHTFPQVFDRKKEREREQTKGAEWKWKLHMYTKLICIYILCISWKIRKYIHQFTCVN